MFCKWCGADLPNSATKCTRCGKDVPAMSDCGGFYDLVPNAKRRTAEGPVSTPVGPKVEPVNVDPVKNDTPKKEVPAKGKKSGRKSNGLQLLITCVGFIIVIALLLGLNSKIGKALDSVENSDGRIVTIYEELQQIKNSIQGEENEESTPPTEGETVPNNVLLEEQDIKIEIVADHAETGTSVKTTADLGNFEDTVVDQVVLDSATQSLAGVQIDLSEAENCIEVKIVNKPAASSYGKGSISVDFDIDEKIFAEVQDDAEYEWAYRIAGSTEWTSLDEDVFTISEDGETVTYTANKLVDLLEDAEIAEFRLTYKRNNVKDGSLTIIISGITVTNQSLEIKSNTYN